MTLYSVLSLTAVMMILAAIPSASVLLVLTRTLSLNARNGFAAVVGIVVGDLLYVLLAVFGLVTISEILGSLFSLIRYLAATYLITFGISLMMRAGKRPQIESQSAHGGLVTSFAAAFMLTLGDIKAILFYSSLLPGFIDVSSLSHTDLTTLVLIVIVSVGGIKTLYVLMADRVIQSKRNPKFEKWLKVFCGAVLFAVGCYLLLKT